MTKPKTNVKFQHRERRMSRSSMSDMSNSSPIDERSPTRANGRPNGAKSPTRNGNLGIPEKSRPDYSRTDTGMTEGWETDGDQVSDNGDLDRIER